MQSPSIDTFYIKSDMHIYKNFFSLSNYWEILIFWGKKPATHVYISMLTYISWSSSALWLSSYSLCVYRSKHLLFPSICLENVNIKQTLCSLPWIINSSSRAVKQKNISPLVSPISVWYSIYLPTFVTN